MSGSGMMPGMPQGPAAGMSQGPMSAGQPPAQMSPQMMQALMAMRAQQQGAQGMQGAPQMPRAPMQGMPTQGMPPQQQQMPPHLMAHAQQMQPQAPMLSQGIPSVPHNPSNASGPGPMQSPGAQAQRSVPISNPNLAMFGRAATANPNQPPDPSKLKLTSAEWAQMGRFGDTIIAHLTPGEIAVPPQVQTPKLMQELQKAFKAAKVSVPQFTAGSKQSSVNPKSGLPEYNWLSAVLPLLAAGGLAATGVGLGADLLGGGAAAAGAGAADASAVPGLAASGGIAGGTGALDAGTIASLSGVAGDGVADSATGLASGLGATDAGTTAGLGGSAASSAAGAASNAVGGALGASGATNATNAASSVNMPAWDGATSTGANPVQQAASIAPQQQIGASGGQGTIQSTGATQPGASGPLQAPSNQIPGQMSATSSNPGPQMSTAAQNQIIGMGNTPTTASGQTASGVSQSANNNGMFGSIGNWINNNQALALKLGIAGGGGLLAAGSTLLGPHSKSPLQSSQYTAHMPAVNPNYQQLLGNASKGYQSTPQFANYNPITSVTGTSGLYNFYNPSMNTGQNSG